MRLFLWFMNKSELLLIFVVPFFYLQLRMVVESINSTSLKVNPKFRLSDKFHFSILANVGCYVVVELQTYNMMGNLLGVPFVFLVGH